MTSNSTVWYYLLYCDTHINAAPEIGAFSSLSKIKQYVDDTCVKYGEVLILCKNGQPVYICRKHVEEWSE